MSKRRLNYNYAQINVLNIVVSISAMWEPVPENHPYYDKMIPIHEYDESLVGKRYIGRDEECYGLFEPVEQDTPDEQEHTENETE